MDLNNKDQRERLISSPSNSGEIRGINDSMFDSQIDQDPQINSYRNTEVEAIGEVSDENLSSAEEDHKKVLDARQKIVVVDDSSVTKKSIQHWQQRQQIDMQ